MKKPTFYFFVMFLFMTAVCCGNDDNGTTPSGGDPGTGGGDSPEKVALQLSKTGILGVSIKDLSTDFVQDLQVQCVGNKTAASDLSFVLAPWTDEELTAYNEQKGTDYLMLPASTYTLSTTDRVAKGKTSADVSITFKNSELLKAVGTSTKYVLPLRLTSSAASVESIRSEVLFTVSLYIPSLQLLSKDYGTVFVEDESTVAQIATRLMRGSSAAESTGTLDYTFKVPENAAALLAEYNNAHGTGYELLPAEAYTMGTAHFNAGDRSSTGTITFNKSAMGTSSYVLFFQVDGAADQNVVYDETVSCLVVGKTFYTNPIIRVSVPDPTVIRAQDGYFYLYGTEDTHNIPIYQSKDLVNWTFKNTAFTDATRPTWKGDHSLWAPEIRYINGKYTLYYSWAIWGNHWNSEVGVATSDSPLGPFIDQGQVIDAVGLGVQNSIDQFYFEENGKKYLFWGSFFGIYVVELTDDGLRVKYNNDGTPAFKQQVAGNAYEGTCIYKRGDWYYLFASIGSCCEGANSTYQTVVGRSKSLFGPYVDKDGGRMLDNRHEILISGDGNFVGTGHNSIIQQDDAGQAWMILHGYVKAEADRGRYVMLEQLLWDEDQWPYVKDNGVLSSKSLAPIIK